MGDVELITDHVGPATVQHWQDQDFSDDEAAVQNFKTVLEYGRGLSCTVVDYTKMSTRRGCWMWTRNHCRTGPRS